MATDLLIETTFTDGSGASKFFQCNKATTKVYASIITNSEVNLLADLDSIRNILIQSTERGTRTHD